MIRGEAALLVAGCDSLVAQAKHYSLFQLTHMPRGNQASPLLANKLLVECRTLEGEPEQSGICMCVQDMQGAVALVSRARRSQRTEGRAARRPPLRAPTRLQLHSHDYHQNVTGQ